MPLQASTYQPPFVFRNAHIATIYSGLFRKVAKTPQKRERLTLADGDFLDLDWGFSTPPSSKVLILLHGLEGNAQRPYMLGSVRAFTTSGFDVCAVNFRGCSGNTNHRFRSYHSGATEDLEEVLGHVIATSRYSEVYLKGFSLGANVVLKYLGERTVIHPLVKASVAVSVPCDLSNSLEQLMKPKNWMYSQRFLKNLKDKLREKQKFFPEQINETLIRKIKTLKDFDDYYTSVAHGFRDADDYYQQASSLQFIEGITVPTLILNAKNDTFLGDTCYPVELCRAHPNVFLEIPQFGGHVGFFRTESEYYNETRAINFLESVN